MSISIGPTRNPQYRRLDSSASYVLGNLTESSRFLYDLSAVVTLTVDGRRILVVEDDRGTREFVALVLGDAGYEVAEAGDGWDGLAQAEQFDPELAIVDLGLPGSLSGMELARRLRRSVDLGLIVLTGSEGLGDEEAALDAGADDYVTKPVTGPVLVARVRALLRRVRPPTDEVHRVGDLVVDDGHHLITNHGQPIQTTPTEFQILLALARQPGRPVSKEQLLRQVWGPEYVGERHERRMVEVHVSRLRHKLEVESGRVLDTVRGAGYVLRI